MAMALHCSSKCHLSWVTLLTSHTEQHALRKHQSATDYIMEAHGTGHARPDATMYCSNRALTCDGGRLEPREEVVHSTLHHESEVAFALLDSIVQLFKIFVNPSLTSHTHNRYAWWAAVRLQASIDIP